jgi:hypothetical protein
MAGVVLLAAWPAQGVLEDKIFTSSGQILPGEEWNSVYVYNDDTVVDMLGGFVEGLGTYDASTVNVTAGEINTLDATDFSTANVSGGDVLSLWAFDSATARLSGTATCFNIGARGSFGVLNMSGGSTEYLGTIESGTLNLYGGVVTDSLGAWDTATINIFGYDLLLTSSGGSYGYGQVSGFWLDHTPFTINLNGEETYTHINLIPEPASLLLLGLGAAFLRRKRAARSKSSPCGM